MLFAAIAGSFLYSCTLLFTLVQYNTIEGMIAVSIVSPSINSVCFPAVLGDVVGSALHSLVFSFRYSFSFDENENEKFHFGRTKTRTLICLNENENVSDYCIRK